MKHLDLFSGIGGFALAAKWIGLETVAFCERDKYAAGILQQHWPDVPIYDDIRNIKQRIGCDIITGGFPCQPFSVAGKQTGTPDDRYLWPEMLRIIAQERPTWVVGENVTGIIGLALDQVLFDLESQGYTARPFVIPAVAVDAPHRRDRVWIVAQSSGVRRGENVSRQPDRASEALENTNSRREGGRQLQRSGEDTGAPQSWSCSSPGRPSQTTSTVANSCGTGCKEEHPSAESKNSGHSSWCPDPGRPDWPTEPGVGRVAHGIPNRVDRIKALGNAIVPQVAYQIFKAINAIQRD